MSTMLDPYRLELRAHDTVNNRVEFIVMTGRNAGHCVNKATFKFAGWEVTRADEEHGEGAHEWDATYSTCVHCGVREYMAVDNACSGVYGLL